MNKKELRYSFNKVLDAAESLKCESLHHKPGQKHGSDYICSAEYELQKHAEVIRQYMKDNNI